MYKTNWFWKGTTSDKRTADFEGPPVRENEIGSHGMEPTPAHPS